MAKLACAGGLLALLLLAGIADGRVVKKRFRSKHENFIFVGKFAFGTGHGHTHYTVTAANTNVTHFCTYDEEPDSWPAIWHNPSETCAQKVAHSKRPDTLVKNNTEVHQNIHDHHPHFWFWAVAQCDLKEGDVMEFWLEMEMHNVGGSWVDQFSYDELGIEAIYMVAFLGYLVGTIFQLISVWMLMRNKSFHPIVQLLSCSIIIELLSSLCIFVHWAIYQRDGIGAPGLKGVGEVLDFHAVLVFMFLLVLLAQGWAISYQELHRVQKTVLLVGAVIFYLLYICLFIWQYVGMNPASNVYIYETVPGIILAVVRGATLVFFICNIIWTFLKEANPSKKIFYVWFSILYSVWFASLPFIVIIATAMPDVNRYKVVQGVYVFSNMLFMGILAVMLHPKWASKFFELAKPDMLLNQAVTATGTTYDAL